MAGYNGRKFTVDFNSTTLVGVISRSLSISADFVDVTSDDDSGWATKLAEPGLRSVSASVSGVSSDEVLIAAIMQSGTFAFETLDLMLPTGTASGVTTAGKLSGSFALTSVEISGETDGRVEFSGSLESSGEITLQATV